MDRQSPFPGMDPFMERPSLWRGIHQDLTIRIRDQINETLPDNFDVNIEGDMQLIQHEAGLGYEFFRPDVYILKRSPVREAQAERVAIAEPLAIMPVEEEVESYWLEIVDRDNQQLVTTIEILSPSNKTGAGFSKFREKRRIVRVSGSNWLEIDLLRRGKRPYYMEETPPCDYYAMMMRGGEKQHKWYVWPMMLQERLPTIGVPLTNGYDDLPLDLQRAIDIVYKQARFWRKLRYGEPVPPPKISAENQRWVEQKLTEWKNVQPE